MNYIILERNNQLGKVLKGTCNQRPVEFSFRHQAWVYVDDKEIVKDAQIKNWIVEGAMFRKMH